MNAGPTTTETLRLRSYSLRNGRMGVTRRAALETLLDRFSLPAGPVDPAGLFGPGVPVVLEIGFGGGSAALAMAAADPGTGLIAADVHTPGVATLLLGLDRLGLANVRIAVGDGRDLLEQWIAPGSLAGVRVYFPDPWPKARHHKRRLVDASFVALVADRLAPGGLLHCATDWEPYAGRMLEVIEAEPRLTLDPSRGRPPWRPVTAYEARGLDRGHRVVDLLARRTGDRESGPTGASAS